MLLSYHIHVEGIPGYPWGFADIRHVLKISALGIFISAMCGEDMWMSMDIDATTL